MSADFLRDVLLFGGLGVAAGVLSGLFGIGGGVIIVPVLVFVLGMTQHSAQGTSLAALIPPVGLLGAIRYFKAGSVNVPGAVLLAIGLILGAYLGADQAARLSDTTLRRAFAIFLAIIAARMFFERS